MKKLALLISISLLTLTSCSDDDNNETTSSDASFIGAWKLDKIQYISGKDSSILEERIKKNDCERKSTYKFTADNKYITKIFVQYNGECIEDGSDDSQTYSYNKSEKTLEFNNSGHLVKITKLTSNELTLEGIDEDKNNDGVQDITKISFYK